MRSAARHSTNKYLRISFYNPYSIVKELQVAKTNAERNRRLCSALVYGLANAAMDEKLVELIGIEPTTLCLQSRCSPS